MSTNVFVNCPFDDDYKPMLRAILFTLRTSGFTVKIANEKSDSGEVRLIKIKQLIRESTLSIHDVSRMEQINQGDLPRFNMPFELGLDFGSREYGSDSFSDKKFLILEKERYRYLAVLSDISGNDIRAHKNEVEKLVYILRDWLYENTGMKLRTSSTIWREFQIFNGYFTFALKDMSYTDEELEKMRPFEFIKIIDEWVSTVNNNNT